MNKLFTLLLLLNLISCQRDPEEKGTTRPDPSVTGEEAAPPRLASRQLGREELRSIARDPSEKNIAQLKRGLSGSNDEKLWSTFGLGLHCLDFANDKTLHFLINATSSWVSEKAPPSAILLNTAGWAIGSCASEEAEEFLRSWLSPDPSAELDYLLDAAVVGLGALVDRRGRLNERTQTALLNSAKREMRAEILLPLGRLDRLSDAVGAHILEVAGALLTSDRKKGRRQAIFALGSAGPSAAVPLSQVLLAKAFTPQERAGAAQALGRMGAAGQEALDDIISQLLKRGLPLSYDRPLWIPLRAALDALGSPRKSRPQLTKVRGAPFEEASERKALAQRRRLTWLRCRAADLLAGSRENSPALLSCGPASEREASLARLRVLSRTPLKKKRLKSFLNYLSSDDPVIAQAALRSIPSHPELPHVPELLLDALTSSSPGNQATAAQIIAAYPTRALSNEDSEVVDTELLAALRAILDGEKVPTETKAAVIKAAGALQALSLKAEVEELCSSSLFPLAKAAEQALALMGNPDKKCSPPQVPAKEKRKAKASPPVSLRIDSDVGELRLHLDDNDAPASRERFLALVDEGFYNGIKVRGTRPGFALQFGDKNGDGYDEIFTKPLPNEVSPTPFEALSFGMSAFAPGAQNSQIFVLVSDAPQLMGSRVRLGSAEGPWHLLVEGDVFHSVERFYSAALPKK